MRQREEERARQIADRIAGVSEQSVVELDQSAVDVFVASGGELTQYERMAANGTLAEDDQAAGQDVRALNRNRDRRRHVTAGKIVVRAHHDGLATVYVHGIGGDLATQFRAVVLENRGWYGRLFTLVDGARRHGHGGIHDVTASRDAREGFADTLEIRDRRIELLANSGVGARRIGGRLAATRGD